MPKYDSCDLSNEQELDLLFMDVKRKEKSKSDPGRLASLVIYGCF